MEPATQWMPVLLGGTLGGLAALVVNFLVEAWRRKRRIKSHLSSLAAEIEECHRITGVYQTDRVAAPLYRFPTLLYDKALPGLLADGALTVGQLEALLKFYSEVETVNRGLDRIDNLFIQGQLKDAQQEFGRILRKVDHVIEAYTDAKRAASP